MTIEVPVDLADRAGTTQRAAEAIDALEHAPHWPPGEPIVEALLRWNRAVQAAEAQYLAGDQLGAQRALETALLEDARGAGALLDRLANDAALPDVARVAFPCRTG